jgi:Spy/CpxP family protein refolding chaperone
MKEELTLTEAQTTKIKVLMEEAAKAVKENQKAQMEVLRAKKEDFKEGIKEILTSEQAEKYDLMMQKQKEGMKNHFGPRGDRDMDMGREQGRMAQRKSFQAKANRGGNRMESRQIPQRDGRQAPDPEERQEKVINKMKEELTLTEDQTAKIKGIMEQHMEEVAKDRETIKNKRAEEGDAVKENRKAEMEVLREKQKAYNEKIKEVLTPEQAEKYDLLLQKQKERMKNHFGPRGDGDMSHGEGI